MKTVSIKIIGTEHDAQLLKKVLRSYIKQGCSEGERSDCESYIRIIEYQEKRAEKGEQENG